MALRILRNLFISFLVTALITAAAICIVSFGFPKFAATLDLEMTDLFVVQAAAQIFLLLISLIAMLAVIPPVWNNAIARLVTYFIGPVLYIIFTATEVHAGDIEAKVLIWGSLVLFLMMHTWFYFRLSKKYITVG